MKSPVNVFVAISGPDGAWSRTQGRQEAAANARKPPALRVIEYR